MSNNGLEFRYSMKYGIQVKTSLDVIEKIQEPSFDL